VPADGSQVQQLDALKIQQQQQQQQQKQRRRQRRQIISNCFRYFILVNVAQRMPADGSHVQQLNALKTAGKQTQQQQSAPQLSWNRQTPADTRAQLWHAMFSTCGRLSYSLGGGVQL
jgi:hypothetical protein